MKVYKTAKIPILGKKNIEPTILIYREALSYIIDVCYKERDIINEMQGIRRVSFVENLIHATKKNPAPKYSYFDERFYKYPSYLRRSTIAIALGIVDSYISSLANYEKKKADALAKNKKFSHKPPRLSYNHKAFPILYKGNTFDDLDLDGTCLIKLFLDNDWKYVKVSLDIKALYSSKSFRFKDYITESPTLVLKSKRFYLYVPFAKDVELTNSKNIAIGVDLGLNKSAVVSAIASNGTVMGRLFIDQPVEKDRLEVTLKRLNEANRKSGRNKKPNIWRKINNLIKTISQDTANRIIDFALRYNADVIVFEYLNFKKIKKKKLRTRMQYWAKRRVQELVKNKAHGLGLRFARINPKNTSALAYDGSGFLTRNKNKAVATFSSGKRYNADLNASYNIAARFFLREIARAKVPVETDRTSQTLSTLIDLSKRNNLPLKVA